VVLDREDLFSPPPIILFLQFVKEFPRIRPTPNPPPVFLRVAFDKLRVPRREALPLQGSLPLASGDFREDLQFVLVRSPLGPGDAGFLESLLELPADRCPSSKSGELLLWNGAAAVANTLSEVFPGLHFSVEVEPLAVSV